jgi:amphi-Trp domain-containing protein
MPEDVLFETEQHLSRTDAAAYLQTVADRLDGGGTVSLSAGTDAIDLDVPESVTFEVKAEREGPTDGSGELSIEFELEWPEGAGDDAGADAGLEIS